MIRILHSVSNVDRGGIETMLMNYYRHIDRSKLQFDFIVNKPKTGDYDDAIRSLGGNIYLSPGLNPINYPKYLKFVEHIIKSHSDIKIVHAHNEAMGLYALNGAKKAGINVRIAHAHNTRIIKDYKYPLKLFCKQFLPYSATELWSCGEAAGEYFFGKSNWHRRGMLMHNAIETDTFAFCEQARRELRAEFELGDKNVIGHAGRFNVQKNHTRLLDIFAEYAKINSKSALLLVGEGELEDETKRKAHSLGIADKVVFAGLRNDVSRLYSAMDIFIMPSLFEGLPVVGIEAQCSGLPCLFADTVTDEVVLTDTARRISLRLSDKEWAGELLNMTKANIAHTDGRNDVIKEGYDIATEARRIEKLYFEMSEA